MPYIKQELRLDLDMEFAQPNTVGELTYKLYDQALDYLFNHNESYQTYAEIVAAFENAKLEFYRRKVAPYEDRKIAENGDVE